MDLNQFVYDAIKREAEKRGALAQFAQRNAEIGCQMYKQSSFFDKTAGKMIERMVKEAVKETKAFNKSIKTAKGK